MLPFKYNTHSSVCLNGSNHSLYLNFLSTHLNLILYTSSDTAKFFWDSVPCFKIVFWHLQWLWQMPLESIKYLMSGTFTSLWLYSSFDHKDQRKSTRISLSEIFLILFPKCCQWGMLTSPSFQVRPKGMEGKGGGCEKQNVLFVARKIWREGEG